MHSYSVLQLRYFVELQNTLLPQYPTRQGKFCQVLKKCKKDLDFSKPTQLHTPSVNPFCHEFLRNSQFVFADLFLSFLCLTSNSYLKISLLASLLLVLDFPLRIPRFPTTRARTYFHPSALSTISWRIFNCSM
jgi:hypothetical protein